MEVCRVAGGREFPMRAARVSHAADQHGASKYSTLRTMDQRSLRVSRFDRRRLGSRFASNRPEIRRATVIYI